MLRARSGRAGWPAALIPVSAALAVVLAACLGGSQGPTSDAVTLSPPASVEPSEAPTESDAPTVEPTPTPAPGTPTAEPLATDGPAAACSGTDENRQFFEDAAAAIDWAVVCAVLPDGWFLVSGSFQLADGGRVEVAYRGPSDASLALAQGNVCQGDEVHTCAPRDALIGPAVLAGMSGELGQLGAGLVLDVERGGNPMWRANGSGLSEDGFRGIGEAAIVVGD